MLKPQNPMSKTKRMTKADIVKATRSAGQYVAPFDYHCIAKIGNNAIQKDTFPRQSGASAWLLDKVGEAVRHSEQPFIVVPDGTTIDLCLVRHQHKHIGKKAEQRPEIITELFRATFTIQYTSVVLAEDVKGMKE
jgi:hypothetical protein